MPAEVPNDVNAAPAAAAAAAPNELSPQALDAVAALIRDALANHAPAPAPEVPRVPAAAAVPAARTFAPDPSLVTEMNVKLPLAFSGNVKDDGFTATEFIKRISQRRIRKNWTNEQAYYHATEGFTGKALSFLNMLSPEDITKCASNFDLFCYKFSIYFNCSDDGPVSVEKEKLLRRQFKEEALSDYTDRLTEWTRWVFNIADDRYTARARPLINSAKDLPGFDISTRDDAASRAIHALGDEGIRFMTDFALAVIKYERKQEKALCREVYREQVFQCLVAMFLHNDDIKNCAIENIFQKLRDMDFFHRLCREANKKKITVTSSDSKSSSKRVNEIEVIQSESAPETNDTSVCAAKDNRAKSYRPNRGRGRGGNRGKGKPRPSPASSSANKLCEYCFYLGHNKADCQFFAKAMARKQTNAVSQNNTATASTNAVSQSGNADGNAY